MSALESTVKQYAQLARRVEKLSDRVEAIESQLTECSSDLKSLKRKPRDNISKHVKSLESEVKTLESRVEQLAETADKENEEADDSRNNKRHKGSPRVSARTEGSGGGHWVLPGPTSGLPVFPAQPHPMVLQQHVPLQASYAPAPPGHWIPATGLPTQAPPLGAVWVQD